MDEDGQKRTALVVTDVLNDYDHPDADKLIASAEGAVPALRRLISSARVEGVDVIYVQDNHDDWNTSGAELDHPQRRLGEVGVDVGDAVAGDRADRVVAGGSRDRGG